MAYKSGMRVVQFSYEYGHKTRLQDSFGDLTGYSDPIWTMGQKNYIVEDQSQILTDMLWVKISAEHKDDPLFKPVSTVDLDIDIAGVFKGPQYYLRDI